ncbi:sugar O-acetyltransferase [Rapidithrix thailandica]|uniref:Acetyltransferase n=1 Tax=Rapidithrix thailandica TaxID=413964 RepID=A0AAW9SG06_9BACT
MTEKQKMLKGEVYNSRDPELIEVYHKARQLMQAYNQLDSRNMEKREALLKELLEKVEQGVWIEAPFYCDYGEHISIGKNTFVNTNCMFLDNNKITIGDNVLIGPYVQIYTAGHPLKAEKRIRHEEAGEENASYLTFTKPVSIGNNSWVGGNTVIMPGVRIGQNVTIGAGSVVTKDIPDDVLAFGNPCKVIRAL